MVDKKTARELYFPPFVAAIEAGVGGCHVLLQQGGWCA